MTDDIIEKVRLLPCPFCGGEAQRYVHEAQYTWHYVGCGSRKCMTVETERYLIEDDAAKAWNTRAALENTPTDADRAEALAALSCMANRLREDWSGTDGQAVNEEWESIIRAALTSVPRVPDGYDCTKCEARQHQFQIGDRVQVSENYRYGEWRGIDLEVVGIYRERYTDEILYHVREYGDTSSGGADGFKDKDLVLNRGVNDPQK